VKIQTNIVNRTGQAQEITLKTAVYDAAGKLKVKVSTQRKINDSVSVITQELKVKNPRLWSDKKPEMYKAISHVIVAEKVLDDYETPFGIRHFEFDPDKGFLLNGQPVKIRGVCNHHDLGCLGAAINVRALERQLELLKAMGCNGLRTSHNPPTPELLDLCDRMGFIVMDEAFDMWRKQKTDYDYHLEFDEWHERDLADMVRRDRNHPSVFIWSIGNEVIEQWDKNDSSGAHIARELAAIVKGLDKTRPVTAACNDQSPDNPVIRSGSLDLIGYNYAHEKFAGFPQSFPGKRFIASETTSALATRGCYDMPSDSVRFWPVRWDLPFTTGNSDHTCSSYDNCHTPWGSTHAETWSIVKRYDFLSGMYVWTGFDYLGEPTPYGWPSRSSYFGIIDLAGFPKDAYYYYQSEWTDQPVLHIFPHWNWTEGQIVDVWAYTNCDEVELFLNEQSLGRKPKKATESQIIWRITYVPGTLKAIGYKKGSPGLVREVRTAGAAARLILVPDRSTIKSDGADLAFITVKIVDAAGNLVPLADNRVDFTVKGAGFIAGVDNGSQVSHEPFKANARRALNGLCLVVIQSDGTAGSVQVRASAPDLQTAEIRLRAK
jgi:beta-galactosidase